MCVARRKNGVHSFRAWYRLRKRKRISHAARSSCKRIFNDCWCQHSCKLTSSPCRLRRRLSDVACLLHPACLHHPFGPPWTSTFVCSAAGHQSYLLAAAAYDSQRYNASLWVSMESADGAVLIGTAAARAVTWCDAMGRTDVSLGPIPYPHSTLVNIRERTELIKRAYSQTANLPSAAPLKMKACFVANRTAHASVVLWCSVYVNVCRRWS